MLDWLKRTLLWTKAGYRAAFKCTVSFHYCYITSYNIRLSLAIPLDCHWLVSPDIIDIVLHRSTLEVLTSTMSLTSVMSPADHKIISKYTVISQLHRHQSQIVNSQTSYPTSGLGRARNFLNRRTRAHQVDIAVAVVYASYCGPALGHL